MNRPISSASSALHVWHRGFRGLYLLSYPMNMCGCLKDGDTANKIISHFKQVETDYIALRAEAGLLGTAKLVKAVMS